MKKKKNHTVIGKSMVRFAGAKFLDVKIQLGKGGGADANIVKKQGKG